MVEQKLALDVEKYLAFKFGLQSCEVKARLCS